MIFYLKKCTKKLIQGSYYIESVHLTLYFLSANANLDLYENLGSYHYIYNVDFFYLNRVKDTQLLYQNGLILQLVRKKDFHITINAYILQII